MRGRLGLGALALGLGLGLDADALRAGLGLERGRRRGRALGGHGVRLALRLELVGRHRVEELVDARREDGEVAARRGHVAALHRRRSHRPQEGAVAARVPGALGEDAEQEQRDPEGADDLGARDGALRRGGVHGPAERDVQDERRSSLDRRDAHEQVHPPVAGDAGLHGERAEAAPSFVAAPVIGRCATCIERPARRPMAAIPAASSVRRATSVPAGGPLPSLRITGDEQYR